MHTHTHTHGVTAASPEATPVFPCAKGDYRCCGSAAHFFRPGVCVCSCVFSCVQCSTQAHSAPRFGRGFWPRPKQKATVVSLQIACSKYQSPTEASEENIDGYAREGLWGSRWHLSSPRVQRVLAPSARRSSEMEYRLSVSLTIGQDERWVVTPAFRRPKEKRLQLERNFGGRVLCGTATVPPRTNTIAAIKMSLFSAQHF